MNDTYKNLLAVLEKDERLVVDGKLAKNKIVELALNNDEDLITLIKDEPNLFKVFFKKVGNIIIFDQHKFQSFVSNKQFLPDSFTGFKNKIGLTADNNYISESREVVLSFPYKDCVLEGGQTKEDAKRDEIFWNETLAPDQIDRLFSHKTITNFMQYKKGEKVEKISNISDSNLIIKGNNLLTLYSLKIRYQNAVKLIYLDPPYNTPGEANTFSYNNSFNHSSWLVFMKNRLEISKELLRNDGVIAITIDDEEQAYLKVLCDEIFGRDNFIGTIVVQSNPRGRTINSYFATSHEYMMFYGKDISKVSINYLRLTEEQKADFKFTDTLGEYRLLPFRRSGGTSTPEERPNSFYPIYYCENTKDFTLEKKDGYTEIFPIDKLGKKRVWRQTRPSLLEAVKRGDMVCKKTEEGFTIYMKDRIKEGRKPKTIWFDSKYDASSNGTMLLKGIFSGEKVFSYPKSLYAVKDTIDIITKRGGNDIVLDFFAGSGTTAQAVLELNKEDGGSRRFILCEQLDYIQDVTVARVRKITETQNEGDFIYCELKEANSVFIERITNANTNKELLEIWDSMKSKAFLSYKVKTENIDTHLEEFSRLSIPEQKSILLQILEKNIVYLPYSEIDDESFGISSEDKKINHSFYKGEK